MDEAKKMQERKLKIALLRDALKLRSEIIAFAKSRTNNPMLGTIALYSAVVHAVGVHEAGFPGFADTHKRLAEALDAVIATGDPDGTFDRMDKGELDADVASADPKHMQPVTHEEADVLRDVLELQPFIRSHLNDHSRDSLRAALTAHLTSQLILMLERPEIGELFQSLVPKLEAIFAIGVLDVKKSLDDGTYNEEFALKVAMEAAEIETKWEQSSSISKMFSKPTRLAN